MIVPYISTVQYDNKTAFVVVVPRDPQKVGNNWYTYNDAGKCIGMGYSQASTGSALAAMSNGRRAARNWLRKMYGRHVSSAHVLNRYPYPYADKLRMKLVDTISWLCENDVSSVAMFEYPDYAGLPKSLASYLYTDEVEYIQNNWNVFKNLKKKGLK